MVHSGVIQQSASNHTDKVWQSMCEDVRFMRHSTQVNNRTLYKSAVSWLKSLYLYKASSFDM